MTATLKMSAPKSNCLSSASTFLCQLLCLSRKRKKAAKLSAKEERGKAAKRRGRPSSKQRQVLPAKRGRLSSKSRTQNQQKRKRSKKSQGPERDQDHKESQGEESSEKEKRDKEEQEKEEKRKIEIAEQIALREQRQKRRETGAAAPIPEKKSMGSPLCKSEVKQKRKRSRKDVENNPPNGASDGTGAPPSNKSQKRKTKNLDASSQSFNVLKEMPAEVPCSSPSGTDSILFPVADVDLSMLKPGESEGLVAASSAHATSPLVTPVSLDNVVPRDSA